MRRRGSRFDCSTRLGPIAHPEHRSDGNLSLRCYRKLVEGVFVVVAQERFAQPITLIYPYLSAHPTWIAPCGALPSLKLEPGSSATCPRCGRASRVVCGPPRILSIGHGLTLKRVFCSVAPDWSALTPRAIARMTMLSKSCWVTRQPVVFAREFQGRAAMAIEPQRQFLHEVQRRVRWRRPLASK